MVKLGDPARRSCDACESFGAMLKKIIKQFKDAAKEASDEVGDDLDKISKSCSRASSSRASSRSVQSRGFLVGGEVGFTGRN